MTPTGMGRARQAGADQTSAQAEERTAALLKEIEELKRTRNAVVLAHYYVAPEIQRAADYVGDSFALAKLAVSLPQQVLVIAGVAFMGESMKLLNPGKTVLLPNPQADCPMAHMVERATVDAARAQYGDDLAVACYVNSTAEIKSWSDVCVTSSNAVKIVRALPQRHVLFIPDANLGRYVAQQVPEKHVILNDGCCPYHRAIAADEVRALKAAHPEAQVLAHPECAPEVVALADYVGSTAGIIAYAAQSPAQEFIVLTMEGVSAELAQRCQEEAAAAQIQAGKRGTPRGAGEQGAADGWGVPCCTADKRTASAAGEKGAGNAANGQGAPAPSSEPRKRFYFPVQATCPEMASITLEQVAACLRPDDLAASPCAVQVSAAMAAPAKRMLDRMLELAAQ